eukprot:CAMPEP_0204270502 /NCGR_PEP_ID=MMETSP0468-20130131/18933_1 /ASSEMBLY_ACC=CAM_ASM_000383 /TAXON_ID=2969 /ORGANISM="Oxyrrhis marina" /LENGTH=243 /DNA_ID=CAMNT_0051246047 /DNA_START=64 /DNA_END=795 /DNA_ORIENTATION=-
MSGKGSVGLSNRHLASATAFITFACFSYPIAVAGGWFADPSVVWWLGLKGLVLSLLVVTAAPTAAAAAFILLLRGRYSIDAKRKIIVAALLIPALVTLCAGFEVWSSAGYASKYLISTDCTRVKGKADMQVSWATAAGVFDRCIESATTAVDTRQCPGYKEIADGAAGQAIEYLATMEETGSCTGWCSPSTPIWTSTPSRDACSFVAGLVLKGQASVAGTVVAHAAVVTVAAFGIAKAMPIEG